MPKLIVEREDGEHEFLKFIYVGFILDDESQPAISCGIYDLTASQILMGIEILQSRLKKFLEAYPEVDVDD